MVLHKSVKINLKEANLSIETEKFIILQIGTFFCILYLHEFFSNNPFRNIFVWPFSEFFKKVRCKRGCQFDKSCFFIKFSFVFTNNNVTSTSSMCSFQNKLIRKTITINIFCFLPYSQCRNYILLTDDICNIFLYSIFIYHYRVFRFSIIHL